MKRFSLALAAIAALTLAIPAHAGSAPSGHNYGSPHQQNVPYGAKPRKKGPYGPGQLDARQIEQIRKECRMYSFKHWRSHPDYQHCRYF